MAATQHEMGYDMGLLTLKIMRALHMDTWLDNLREMRRIDWCENS
jgi:hypothetical protein